MKIQIGARDGAQLIEGWVRADTPKALETSPRPIDVKFSVLIPAGLNDMDLHWNVCTPMFYKIQNGESLMGLDFTPPPPVQAETSWGGALEVGIFGLAVFAFVRGSQN